MITERTTYPTAIVHRLRIYAGAAINCNIQYVFFLAVTRRGVVANSTAPLLASLRGFQLATFIYNLLSTNDIYTNTTSRIENNQPQRLLENLREIRDKLAEHLDTTK